MHFQNHKQNHKQNLKQDLKQKSIDQLKKLLSDESSIINNINDNNDNDNYSDTESLDIDLNEMYEKNIL